MLVDFSGVFVFVHFVRFVFSSAVVLWVMIMISGNGVILNFDIRKVWIREWSMPRFPPRSPWPVVTC